MSDKRPSKELMISFNYLFPEALEGRDTSDYTGPIAERLQKVITEELNRLDVRHAWGSTRFLYFGTGMIPDSTRCSDCGTWVIPEERSHPTSVVPSGWRVDDGPIRCDGCWSLFDREIIEGTNVGSENKISEQGEEPDAGNA